MNMVNFIAEKKIEIVVVMVVLFAILTLVSIKHYGPTPLIADSNYPYTLKIESVPWTRIYHSTSKPFVAGSYVTFFDAETNEWKCFTNCKTEMTGPKE